MSEAVYTVVVGVLAIGGACFVLLSVVGMLRVPDAVSRVNVLSPATGVGLPCIFLAVWVHHLAEAGFDGWALVRTLIAVVAMLMVSSVASNAIARATYRSAAPVAPATQPNELADGPDES